MVRIQFRKLPKIDRLTIYLSFALRVILLIAVGTATWERNLMLVFLSSFIFILTFIPSLIAKNIKVNLPTEFEFIAILFIFVSLFLGDINKYYFQYYWWDIMLHGFASLILGFIGFIIIFIMYDRHKVEAKPIVIALFSFCFAMAIGAVWEIVEFAIDSSFGTHMQGSGLVDTMWDLIIDGIGALVIAAACYFYVKGKPSLIIKPALKHFINQNPHLYTDEKNS